MSYKTQSGNAKFYWAAIAVICGYTIGAYDKSHSFLVLQKLGASVTAIHLLVSGIVLFYTVTALKLVKDRAHLALSKVGETLQDVSEQASSDIAEAITGLQEVAEQIKAEVAVMNIRDVHDKLGRISQSIQIAAAKPQVGQSHKEKQKSPGTESSQPAAKQGQETQKPVDSTRQGEATRNQTPEHPRAVVHNSIQGRPVSPEQKAQGKTRDRKQEVTAQQTVSHETANTKVSQPSEKPNVPAPTSSKPFRPEPQPPVKPGVNEEAFL